MDGLPLSKKATPAQMLLLLICILFLLGSGGGFAIFAWSSRNDIVTAIKNVDIKVDSVKQSQEWMRRSTLSKAEMTQWVMQLDRSNRETVPKLVVPYPPVQNGNPPPSEPPIN